MSFFVRRQTYRLGRAADYQNFKHLEKHTTREYLCLSKLKLYISPTLNKIYLQVRGNFLVIFKDKTIKLNDCWFLMKMSPTRHRKKLN